MSKPPCEDLEFDRAPKSFDVESEVRSMSDPGIVYRVNAYRMTCTCPDFIKRGQHQEIHSSRRLCKHLVDRLYDYCEADEEINIAFRAVITYAAEWRMPRCFGMIETSCGPAVIFYNEWGGWVNVITPYEWDGKNQGEALYYGYSLNEHRWANELSPENAVEIERTLTKIG